MKPGSRRWLVIAAAAALVIVILAIVPAPRSAAVISSPGGPAMGTLLGETDRPLSGAPRAVGSPIFEDGGLLSGAPQPAVIAQHSSQSPAGSGARPGPASVPAPTGEIGSALLGGYATWYAACHGCGAAGPVLRDALGAGWRGSLVTVCARACVPVRLTDYCACGERHGRATLVDLDSGSFARLAPLSLGVVAVSIELSAKEETP